jgi:hypothetical protein
MLPKRFYKRSSLFVAAIFAISLLGWAVIFGLAYKSAIDLRTSLSSENSQKSSKISKSLGKKFEWLSAASDLPTNVLISKIPLPGNVVSDLRQTSHVLGDIGSGILASSDEFFAVQENYKEPIYADKKINVEKLLAFENSFKTFNPYLQSALSDFEMLSPDGFVSGKIGKSISELEKFGEASDSLVESYKNLGEALGSGAKVNYLVTVGNQAELRASGGAPLSIALVSITDGQIQIEEQGQISTEFFYGNPKISWPHIMTKPFATSEDKAFKFVNSNIHPDFRIAGEEIMRAWDASSGIPVVGVISLDSTSISKILSLTGPVETSNFGEINSDNFTQRMLIDSYRELSNEGERQALNDFLASEIISRFFLLQPLDILKFASQNGETRNLQINLRNPELQKMLEILELSGSGPAAFATPNTDVIALYSKNRNQAKSDVFQIRSIDQTVNMTAGGGAKVSRKTTIENRIPAGLSGEGKIGYTTLWNKNYWIQYIPQNAQNVSVTLPADYETWSIESDALGGKFVWTWGGWIAPNESIEMLISYDLPANTFANNEYTIVIAPQPVLNPPELNLSVFDDSGTKMQSITNSDDSGYIKTTEILTFR